jgi:hypothetical protein
MRVRRRWLVATLSVLLLATASIAVAVWWRRAYENNFYGSPHARRAVASIHVQGFAVRNRGREGTGSYVVLAGEPHDDLFPLISGDGLDLTRSAGAWNRFEERVADGYFRFRGGVECDVGVTRFRPGGEPPGDVYGLPPDEDARAGRGEVAVLRLTATCGGK